jgi:glycosyltransferase involved in cell wall biosynthesis
MSGPLTILHVTAPARVGGLERVVEALAAGQRRAGHAVHVAVILDPGEADHPLAQGLRRADVGVAVINPPIRGYRRERGALATLCRELVPDVVHTHGARPDVVDGGVPRGLGIPVVSTVHGFTGGGWKNRLYERLMIRAYRRFSAVVAVSRPIVERLTRGGVPPQRIHLVRNAWSGGAGAATLSRAAARAALGIAAEGEGPRVGWIGRISQEKGPDVIVDAMARTEDPRIRLSMVGEGRAAAALRARAAASGLEDRVTWHGNVPDAGGLMPAFDVFVLSSRTEGTPIVLFEAMAAGVPIVATAVGGVPDVISAAEAILVPAEDAAALARAIGEVLRDPAGARSRGEAARRRLEREFAAEPWVHRYLDIYRSVTVPGGGGAQG